MKQILAQKTYRTWDAEDAPMCSFSERDEVYQEVIWKYDLPEGYAFTKKPTQTCMPIINQDNPDEVIGYAAKCKIVLFTEVFNTVAEAEQSPMFHTGTYQVVPEERVNEIIAQNEEMEGWGD